MDYQQTLDYLYNSLPMFSRMGSAAYKADLTNIQELCKSIGNPQNRFKSIHVAGTNGKGSVSHMLAAVFQTAGYKTGLYTSPHLYDFRERIRLNGEKVPQQFVVDFVGKIKGAAEVIQPSFFELTVAMAFAFFSEQEVDIAIIEVGLGGRLDSTNIITPELSVITNIGRDHVNILGDTMEQIAAEKGGIIKRGVPVVIGETLPPTRAIFQSIAQERSSPIHFAEDEWIITSTSLKPNALSVALQSPHGVSQIIETDLPGIYQAKNIRTVLTSLQVLKELSWQLADAQIASALQQVRPLTGLMGRWQVISNSPDIVLEVAHNKDGVRQMLAHIQQLQFDNLHLVMGMVKDKEIDDVLQLLPTRAHYYFSQATTPRALPAAELQQQAAAYALTGDAFEDVNDALAAAKQRAGREDLIVVCGSIFLVAEVVS